MHNPPLKEEEIGLNSRQRREIEEMVKNLLQQGLNQIMNQLNSYTNPYK